NKDVFTSAQFVRDLPAGAEDETGMSIRMIPNRVVSGMNLFSELWILSDVLTKNKECRLYPIFLQERQQLWSDSGIRSVIKGQRAGVPGGQNRRSEQLRSRVKRGPGRNSQRSHGWNNNLQRVHRQH